MYGVMMWLGIGWLSPAIDYWYEPIALSSQGKQPKD